MPGGRLVVDAYLTRAGVFEYADSSYPDGIRRELRPPDEVSAAESLATLTLAPLTLDHPSSMVTVENARGLMRGAVGENVTVVDDIVQARIGISDDEALRAVESGVYRETSCGYSCDIDDTPGEYEGERYDVVQRRIRYDHVALVEAGRAKLPDSIRADSVSVHRVDANTQTGETKMTEKVKVRVVKLPKTRRDMELPDEAAEAIMAELEMQAESQERVTEELAKAKAQSDEMAEKLADGEKEDEEEEKKMADMEAAKDEAEAQRDEYKEKADAMPKLVRERVKLLRVAESILGEGYKADGAELVDLDESAIKMAVIKSRGRADACDGKSADYVNARFDAIVESMRDADFNPAFKTTPRSDDDDVKREDNTPILSAQERLRKRTKERSNAKPTTKARA